MGNNVNDMSLLRRIVSCFMMLCGAAVLFSCGGGTKQEEATPKAVNIAECKDASVLPPTSFAGLTRSVDQVNVAFRVSGTISRVLVKEGDRVQKGQLIAVMDDRDYRLQLNATKAEYEQIKADAERVIAMYEDGSTTAQNYDKARYGLEQITQKLGNHTNQLNDTRLVAPISGSVKRKLRESGEAVAAGLPVVELSSSDRIEVEIDLPAAEFMHIDEYVEFYCTFNVTGTQKFPLKVVRKDVEANANQLYKVYLQFADGKSHKGITAGMSTMVYGKRVRITDGQDIHSGDILIPATALVTEDETPHVFVLDEKEHVVRKREVKVEFINPDGTIAVSNGLKVGEKVVRTGAHNLTDREKVEIMEKASKSNVGGML